MYECLGGEDGKFLYFSSSKTEYETGPQGQPRLKGHPQQLDKGDTLVPFSGPSMQRGSTCLKMVHATSWVEKNREKQADSSRKPEGTLFGSPAQAH